MLWCMRTTVTLDDDVAAALRDRRVNSGLTFKQVLNDAIRHGLVQQAPRTESGRRTEPVDLGEVLVPDLDNVQAVLDLVEGPDRR